MLAFINDIENSDSFLAGATCKAQAKLSKEEAKATKCYMYQQQLVCKPEVQNAVLSDVRTLTACENRDEGQNKCEAAVELQMHKKAKRT